MSLARRAVVRLRREERGLTLIELLVAATVGLVVVGGAMTMFVSGIRSEPRTASKVTAIQQARTTMDRITRELRQGLETPVTSSSQLAIVTYVKAQTCGGAAASSSIPCRVTYSCAVAACNRTVAQPDGSAPGPTVQVASGLSSPDVFSYLPPESAEPSYVGVAFSFVASADGTPVTLEDGVALRNAPEEGEGA